jgi:hypothetical protein
VETVIQESSATRCGNWVTNESVTGQMATAVLMRCGFIVEAKNNHVSSLLECINA